MKMNTMSVLFLQKTLEFITPIRYNRTQYELVNTCIQNIALRRIGCDKDEQCDHDGIIERAGRTV